MITSRLEGHLVRRTGEQMRRDALDIWRAGVAAVRSDELVRKYVRLQRRQLIIGAESLDLGSIRHILVVGAGKAGAGMAAGLEAALGTELMDKKQLAGWVHVPQNCLRPLARIHLHAARPAGVNEPTQAGIDGSRQMMRRASALGPDDLCLALISGGGSALLPLPIEGITLEDKRAVTRFLSGAGAPIDHLNTVRKALSRIKGGGLARACRAGRLIALVISDVLGDPLDLIASAPTVNDTTSADEAMALLERYGARGAGISPRVFDALAQRQKEPLDAPRCQVTNLVIGNNATAVEAAAEHARSLGYTPSRESARASEGPAEEVGRRLVETGLAMRAGPGTDCLVSGGEPTVTLLDTARRGLGGRNQQLVLSAAVRAGASSDEGLLILSGGTDGEDGPTDAAGAFLDHAILEAAQQQRLHASNYLERNDAYHFFEPLGALIKTGPTDTNVCDLRVVLVDRVEAGETPTA